ncbi:unnamed protein product [Candida verbasci]|uniref:Intramembrane protease n=1 Tax=Candida verbasci TaxID=1227364 RepID=A0A9W4U090_9ASCO|nr:unnamed protein product [Candida verbasci]
MNSTNNMTNSLPVPDPTPTNLGLNLTQELQIGVIILIISLISLILGSYSTISKPKIAKDARLDTDSSLFDPTDLDNSSYYILNKFDLQFLTGASTQQFSIISAILIPIFACITLISLYYLLKYVEDLNYYLQFYILLINPYSLNSGITTLLTMTIRKFTHLIGKNSNWVLNRWRLILIKDEDDFPIGNVEYTKEDKEIGENFEDYLRVEKLIHLEPTSIKIRNSKSNIIFNVLPLLTLPVSLGLTYYNFYYNSNGKNWIISNLLSFSYIITSFKQIKVPQFKISVLLLSLLFFYDVYFVFGSKIMLTVAQGIEIPIKLMIPRIGSTDNQFSILGLGDIILPGTLVSLCLRFDQYNFYKNHKDLAFHHVRRFSKPYFIVSLLSYAIGLAITWGVLLVFKHGQPALLYLVPSLIIGVFGTALNRGELKELWNYSELISEYKKDKTYTEESDDEEEDPDYIPIENEEIEIDLDEEDYDDNTYIITIDERDDYDDESEEDDYDDESEEDDYDEDKYSDDYSEEQLLSENEELKAKIRSFLNRVNRN